MAFSAAMTCVEKNSAEFTTAACILGERSTVPFLMPLSSRSKSVQMRHLQNLDHVSESLLQSGMLSFFHKECSLTPNSSLKVKYSQIYKGNLDGTWS